MRAGRNGSSPFRSLGPLLVLTLVSGLTLPSAIAADQRALLDLIVNETPRGTVQAVLRAGDALIGTAVLESAGLHGFGGRREVLGGVEHVSLSSLAPAVTWQVDEVSLVLRLSAAAALLGRSVVDLQAGPPPGITYTRDRSAFLNWAASWGNLETLDLFGEAGLSLGNRLLLSTFSLREEGGFVRGLTQLTQDDREHLRRWVIGDHFANSRSPLGGGALLGGVGLSRELGLDPYLVRYPVPDLAGALATPSTVEIYVNGLFVRREQLPAGEFELRNLPVPSGSGETRLVIRDVFGREREVATPFAFTTGLLSKGLSEYGYHLGVRRENLTMESFDYGDPVFLARHRQGITDRVTLGGHLEGDLDLVSGGPSVTLRLGLGELDLAASLSEEEGQGGSAGYATYSYSGRRMGFGLVLRRLSERFANLALSAEIDRPLLETRAFLGLSPGSRLGLTLEAGSRNFRDRRDQVDVRLSSSLRLSDRASLLLVAGRLQRTGMALDETGEEKETEDRLSVGISYFLGRNTTGKVYADFVGMEGRRGVEVQKSLPVGTGYGYRLTADHAQSGTDVEGDVQVQNRYSRLDVSHFEAAGESVTNVNLAGAVVALGGDFHLTRPVQEGFAIIRVPGVEGVRGYLSNQEVGRTDAKGDLLVPNLLPYFGNRLSIADEDVPIDFIVEERERTVAPPVRGGAVVGFRVWKLRAIRGSLAVVSAGGTRVPDQGYLTVTAAARTFESPVGRGGEFYLENVPPGEHPAVLEMEGRFCETRLTVPESEASLVDLGRVLCEVP